MACVDCEGSTFHQITEVLVGKEYGQKLTVEGAVLSLRSGKPAGEEGGWAPVPSQKLFQLTTNSFIRCIDRYADQGCGVRVMQKCGRYES